MTCPAPVKDTLFRLWDRHPQSYDALAVTAGWLATAGVLAVLDLVYWGSLALFG